MSDARPRPGAPPGTAEAGAHPGPPPTGPSSADDDFIQALRRGDEDAFVTLVSRYYTAMLSLAQLYVPWPAVAEEVVQETWIGVLRGIDRFEGRSSLKTWIFRILVNIARTRRQREERHVPLSSLGGLELDADEPAVAPDRFRPADAERWPGNWLRAPQSWAAIPEEQMLSRETALRIQQAIVALPALQRNVIRLRDVEGWSADEVCATLEISESNQRVLLHRARSKVRASLERYLAEK